MYLSRFIFNDHNPKYGLIDDSKIFILNNSFNIELDYIYYKDFITDEVDISGVQFLPPCEPSKIVGIALNYPGVAESNSDLEEPLVFIKGLNTLVLDNVVLDLSPAIMAWGECELAAVIKHKVKNISSDSVHKSILGFMPANDITCNNLYKRDHHLARSKSADGFCPVGKYIDLDYQYCNKKIQGYQNNILIREGNTDDMIFSIEKIIEWLSTWMTLNPGDIILTGAPPRVREKQFLKPGDLYSVRVEGFDNLNLKVS
jgi:2-keto-4-pentenoate hydratase/2-oxohepta-3-ene-1,7-dioic acid hydratase in catechol pathway